MSAVAVDTHCSGSPAARPGRRRSEVFRVDDVAVVIAAGHDELALAAAQVCPATAIAILDGATGRQVHPYRRPARRAGRAAGIIAG